MSSNVGGVQGVQGAQGQVSYWEAWQDYRRRLIVNYWAAGSVLVGLLPYWLKPSPLIKVVAVVWCVLVVSANMYLSQFKCPRCGKYFCGRWETRKTTPAQCFYCGLPKYAMGTDSAPDLRNLPVDTSKGARW